MTIREALLSVSAFPIPPITVEAIAVKRGLDLDSNMDRAGMVSADYRLATADLYFWLFLAPNVAQGGQSYSYADKERFRKLALAIYKELGTEEEADACKGNYGYMGNKL